MVGLEEVDGVEKALPFVEGNPTFCKYLRDLLPSHLALSALASVPRR